MPLYHMPKEQFQPISYEEISKFLDKSNDDDFKRVLILTWLTGSRIAEILELTGSSFLIEEDGIIVTVHAKKHGKIGYPNFAFSDPFIPMIKDFVKTLPMESRFARRTTTRSYQLKLRKINEELYPTDEMKWIVFHQLRHGRISFLARNLQASPEEIKSWTGHRSSAYEDYFASRKTQRFRGMIK